MPWRGPEYEGEFPTLGYDVADWIEAFCVIPDGDHQGEPFLLTDEMVRWLLFYYRLRLTPDGGARFYYRGGQLMRVQKWGKGPFAGAQCHAEAHAPVRFDGWDAAGNPVGKPWSTPWIQIAAVAEDQTDNTYLSVYEMAKRGPIANIPGLDIGVEDINLPSGGKIEPVTSAGKTRLGQRLTFAVQDETHLWTPSSGGKLLAANMRRNLAGMGGRWMETTNAYDPAEGSVAQVTHEGKAADVYIDVRTGEAVADLNDRPKLLEALRDRYGDSWWVDIERIADEVADPGTDEADARRFFLNEFVAGTRAFLDPMGVDKQVRDTDGLRPGDAIALGFDGAKNDDATAIIGTRLRDGRQFELAVWQRPKDAPKEWKVPGPEVDAKIRDAFEVYDVWYLVADPWKWQDYLDAWAADFPDKVVEFPTNVQQRMDRAIERYLTAFKTGEITYDVNPDDVLLQHLKNAVLAKGSKKRARDEDDTDPLATHYLKLAKRKKTLKIDAAVAAVLSWVGRALAIKDGALETHDVASNVW